MSKDHDIVKELRAWGKVGVDNVIDRAADEIERLRADVMCLKYQNAEFVRNLTMAQDERNTAVAERDEMQGELRKAETECSMLRVECGVIAAERDEARQRLCDIVVMVEAEQDQRTSKKHGHDISMLTAVKVVTTFVMTPAFIEDLYRSNEQYAHIGSVVAQTLKNAVAQKQGTDIRSIAIVRPMVVRSFA